MHAFDVLGDPVRRRILELLADGELTAGAVTAAIQLEFGISQPAVSQHLRVLRESGFATVRADGTRRLYAVGGEPMRALDEWLDRFRCDAPAGSSEVEVRLSPAAEEKTELVLEHTAVVDPALWGQCSARVRSVSAGTSACSGLGLHLTGATIILDDRGRRGPCPRRPVSS